MVYAVMAHAVMACVVMAYTVTVYVVMARIVMAYVARAQSTHPTRSRRIGNAAGTQCTMLTCSYGPI